MDQSLAPLAELGRVLDAAPDQLDAQQTARVRVLATQIGRYVEERTAEHDALEAALCAQVTALEAERDAAREALDEAGISERSPNEALADRIGRLVADADAAAQSVDDRSSVLWHALDVLGSDDATWADAIREIEELGLEAAPFEAARADRKALAELREKARAVCVDAEHTDVKGVLMVAEDVIDDLEAMLP